MKQIDEIKIALNLFDKYLRDELREPTDKNIAMYEHWCDTSGAIEQAIDAIEALRIGSIPMVSVNQKVYVVCHCNEIESILDGTWYSSNGDPGTATGYHCPYEDTCNLEDCTLAQEENLLSVFEDRVASVVYDEDGIFISTNHCKRYDGKMSLLGKNVFLTEDEAEEALLNIINNRGADESTNC